MLVLALLSLIAAGPGPVSSLETLARVAAIDSHAQRPEDRPFVRYLSLHAIDEADRSDFMKALHLTINGAQFGGGLARLRTIAGGRLVRIDLRDLKWDRYSRAVALEDIARLGVAAFRNANASFVDIWEGIGFAEPFFDLDLLAVDPALVARFRLESRSFRPVLAAHWLYPRLLLERADGGYYSDLLLNPPTKADLEKRWGVFRQFIDVDPRAKHGAAVVKSASVAYNPREILLLQSSVGWDQFHHWTTSDFLKADRADKDPRESPANTSRPDGQETIFSLPNGLHGYYLNDGKGDQVALVPQQIAEDQRPAREGAYHSPTKSVVNPFKCHACHGESRGIIGFDDNVIRLIVADPRQDTAYLVRSYDKKEAARAAERIEEFYRRGLAQKAEMHRVSYEARVRECTGLDVAQATVLLSKFYDRLTSVYAAELVAPEQAAREGGYPLPAARVLWKIASDPHLTKHPGNQLGFLAAGQSITRRAWEANVRCMLKAAYQPLRPK